jgi:hypothetical protein
MSHQSRSLFGMLAFIIIVAVSGYALTASGNMRNPFEVISDIANITESGTGSTLSGGRLGMGEAREGSALQQGGGPSEQTTIQWNQLGSVLFNLWFLAALSAFVMVVRRILSFVKKLPRRTLPADKLVKSAT